MEAPLDLLRLPRDPVALLAPPSGAVEVVVTDVAGRRVPLSGTANLSWIAPPDVDGLSATLHATAPVRDGRARFGAVLPGAAPLRARVVAVDGRTTPWVTATGPSGPGETVVLRVPLPVARR